MISSAPLPHRENYLKKPISVTQTDQWEMRLNEKLGCNVIRRNLTST